MPHTLSALPGPFLELSTANLHLNDLSVDQLAALWNVFTKVGDSLHKGRRLENFVWRAWHREAHLLPPDASWSDFADCTPLETPALSRAGSISQGLQRRPIVAQVAPGHWAAATEEEDNCPSDPESGADWSDESGDESPVSRRPEATSRPAVPEASSASPEAEGQNTPGQLASNRGRLPSRDLATQRTVALVSNEQALNRSPQAATTVSASMRRRIGDSLSFVGQENANDRKRAASSSSSAFGSRARVRHSNLRKSNRPRPLSFQAALESLATGTESDDLSRLAQEHQKRGLGVAHERRSFQGPQAVDMLKSTEVGMEDHEDIIAASHSSAPAGSGFEERLVGRSAQAEATAGDSTPMDTRAKVDVESATQRLQVMHQVLPPSHQRQSKAAGGALKGQSSSKTDLPAFQAQPVPATINERASERTSPSASRGNDAKKAKAKFFLSASVSKSFDEEDHQFSGQQPDAASAEEIMQADPVLTEKKSATPSREQDEPPHPTTSKSKNDLRTGGLITSHRNRSGASLHKGKGKVGSGRPGSSGRLAASGLMMTKAAAQAPTAPAPLALSANTKGPAKPALVSQQQPARKNKPVKFTMGSSEYGDDDDDEFSDEDEEHERTRSQPGAATKAEENRTAKDIATAAPIETSAPTVTSVKGKQASTVEEDEWQNEDEDEWSSDTSAEAEEERRRVEENARRRRRAEEEHQKSLFKKIPVRSASTADLPSAVPVRPKTPLEQSSPSAQLAPPRGLLSSLFHPEQEPHPPPGQLHGRPHASAADLRGGVGGNNIARPASTTGHKTLDRERKQHRPPSMIGSLPRASEVGGPLRTSKSAVALPVLTNPARDAAGGGLLNPDAEEELQAISTSYVGRAQPGNNDGNGSATSPETRNMLLKKQRSSSTSRCRERPPSSTVDQSPHDGEYTEALPVTTQRRGSNPLPTPAPPQTPRTTRRNMLRDELSESLRQNLLWERQSRNRMLGIGGNPSTTNRPAPTATPADETRAAHLPPAAARASRRETVLGGGQLRPLTQGNSTTHHPAADRSGAGAGTREHRLMEGAPTNTHADSSHSNQSAYVPHYHSRSTPHLPHAATAAKHQHLSNLPARGEHEYVHDRMEGYQPSNNVGGAGGGLLQVRPPVYQRSQSGPASRPSSTSTSDEEGASIEGPDAGTGGGAGGGPGAKKKVMWSGGFPNYHQHGW